MRAGVICGQDMARTAACCAGFLSGAIREPIGRVPEVADIDTRGLDIRNPQVEELLRVDVDGWLAEVPLIREHFAQFGSHLPPEMSAEVDGLEKRLKSAKG
jgi:phosphoenolpyruvate carboxykinase (GTP)